MKKMDYLSCSIPAGKEFICSRLSDALKVKRSVSCNGEISLRAVFSNLGEERLCWTITQKDRLKSYFFAFRGTEKFQGIPEYGDEIKVGEYMCYDGVSYVYCQEGNDRVLRKVTIFATQEMAEMAWAFSSVIEEQGLTDEPHEDYLVMMHDSLNPHKKYGVFWYLSTDNFVMIHPIFMEDTEVLEDVDNNSLNWSTMEVGDTFWHNDLCYEVGKDENDELFIAPTMRMRPRLRIVARNF